MQTSRIYPGLAVDDIAAARAFYGDVLGLTVRDQNEFLLVELGGDAVLFVYDKPTHLAARHTVLNFEVPDLEAAVDELNAKGVQMVRYRGAPHDDKGIVRPPAGEGPDIAWFTDPSDNILAVIQA